MQKQKQKKEIQFSKADILSSVELLIQKFSRIGIFVSILDEYFEDGKFVITRKTSPLAMMLSELTFHMVGQLSRLCFDQSSKNYKTASICEVYKQSEKCNEKTSAKGFEHLARLVAVQSKIQFLEDNYENKLKLFADKHYAHLEIRSDEEIKADYKEFQISWGEIKKIVETSKEVLFEINLFWTNIDTDFADTEYDDFKLKFWSLIHLPDQKSTEFWS